MKRWTSLCIAIAILLIFAAVSQSTDVAGPVTGTWTLAGSPYNVTDSIYVPGNQSLIIEAGVQVIFQGYFKFGVHSNATLQALGNVQDSILFAPADTSTGWQGIRFYWAASESRLEFCHLTRTTGACAVYSYASDITISHCLLDNCDMSWGGGGCIVCVEPSSPLIANNSIIGNIGTLGGGVYCYDADPIISDNSISYNISDRGAGILCGQSSAPIVTGNYIQGNYAYNLGGGIAIESSRPTISNNIIKENTAGVYGGGIGSWGENSDITIQFNEICDNSAEIGGGIDLESAERITLDKNTIANNAAIDGGGIYCYGIMDAEMSNSIVWGNIPSQIYIQSQWDTLHITYSDVQGSWAGTGNINANPIFVDASAGDYHLQEVSPCIDAGNPSFLYNDPDGTRADMGCYYFDQTIPSPVTINLTPIDSLIQIPAGGGCFDFTVVLENTETTPQNFDVWIMVELPTGSWYGPVLGPLDLTLSSGMSLSRNRTQAVPGGAPQGDYIYQGRVGIYPDDIWDQDGFSFTKLGVEAGGSNNTWFGDGDPFANPHQMASETHVNEIGVYPTPFNPTTVFSLMLPVASLVDLRILDIAGRQISTLMEGWCQAGSHELIFDGSKLASGVYLYQLKISPPSGLDADPTRLTGKIVLLK